MEEVIDEMAKADVQDVTGESTAAPEATEPVYKYYYNPKRNARAEMFAGVPLDNLTEDQFKGYPRWLQKAIAGAKFYQAEPPVEED